MTYTNARQWADLIAKLGLPYTKAEIIRFGRQTNSTAVWKKYIASNPLYLDAAIVNKIRTPDDVESYFEEISYAGMRSTFPRKARGRSIIGPRIVPLYELLRTKQLPIKKERTTNSKNRSYPEIEIPRNIVGKKIIHAAPNLISFGPGVIKNVKGDIISVVFEDAGERHLSYSRCIHNNFIRFI